MKEYKLKDNKKRMTFKSGVSAEIKIDKPRFDLLIPENQKYENTMLYRFAIQMAKGAKKYSERNFEKACSKEELARFKQSAIRHFFQWISNETDEDHASAVWFNMLACEYIKEKIKWK